MSRTIAIIAHVDHGKTTLLDHLLRQSGTLNQRGVAVERVMDSNPQERERGITILAKCTAIEWQGDLIHSVDTPGHQDFGGEVERILRMVDSALLLVDAVEGPMPQTRYVLMKALERGLKPIVVINKMDRPEARPDWVVNQVFDLFVALGAHDEQLDFPIVYACGRQGWASLEETTTGTDLTALFETIRRHVPESDPDVNAPLQLQVATLDYSEYLGRIAIGRVYQGTITSGMQAIRCRLNTAPEPFRVTKLLGFLGLERVEAQKAVAGQIVALAGADEVTVGDTICQTGMPLPMDPIPVDPPTVRMWFGTNQSPFAGQEGQFVTSRHLRERLEREMQHNVGLQIEPITGESFTVAGRGTLHLSVLIETMRREGYELAVGKPQVVMKGDEEPWEEVSITVPNPSSGIVIEKLSKRGATLLSHDVDENGIATLRLEAPTRGLIGYRSEFLTDTRGEGIIYSTFSRYAPKSGNVKSRENGTLIVQETCTSNTYALYTLQERGALIVGHGEKVYAGQVIGINSRANDLVVNPGKTKQLTNFRAAGKDDALRLTPHMQLTLEQAIELIEGDELVEVTPKSIRLRKRILDHNARKREEKATKA